MKLTGKLCMSGMDSRWSSLRCPLNPGSDATIPEPPSNIHSKFVKASIPSGSVFNCRVRNNKSSFSFARLQIEVGSDVIPEFHSDNISKLVKAPIPSGNLFEFIVSFK
jgi:hypothetical protein